MVSVYSLSIQPNFTGGFSTQKQSSSLVANQNENCTFFKFSTCGFCALSGLENSTRPLVFTSVSGCRASEYFDISTENLIFHMYANKFCDAGQVPIFRYFEVCLYMVMGAPFDFKWAYE